MREEEYIRGCCYSSSKNEHFECEENILNDEHKSLLSDED